MSECTKRNCKRVVTWNGLCILHAQKFLADQRKADEQKTEEAEA